MKRQMLVEDSSWEGHTYFSCDNWREMLCLCIQQSLRVLVQLLSHIIYDAMAILM
eukprot:c831_g1_i1 orf=2-163(-)